MLNAVITRITRIVNRFYEVNNNTGLLRIAALARISL